MNGYLKDMGLFFAHGVTFFAHGSFFLHTTVIFINNLSQVLDSIDCILVQLSVANDFRPPQKQNSEETKQEASEVVIESSQPQNEIVSDKERLTYLH